MAGPTAARGHGAPRSATAKLGKKWGRESAGKGIRWRRIFRRRQSGDPLTPAALPRGPTGPCRVPSAASCGVSGRACVPCAAAAADTCTAAGACACWAGAACAAGTVCVTGACVCNAQSCPSGCCASGACVSPRPRRAAAAAAWQYRLSAQHHHRRLRKRRSRLPDLPGLSRPVLCLMPRGRSIAVGPRPSVAPATPLDASS